MRTHLVVDHIHLTADEPDGRSSQDGRSFVKELPEQGNDELHQAAQVEDHQVLRDATLVRPPDVSYRWQGKRGEHSEHLGHLLGEMQHMYRAYPGASW